VTHVVNYQCPEDEKTYLHRIGRTGRAGGSGVAVTFVDWDDLHRWTLINTALELPFPDPPETYSTSEHFYEALDIPAGAGGMLPKTSRTRAGLAAEEIEDLGETGKTRSRARPADRKHTEHGDSDRPRSRSGGRSRRRTRGGVDGADSAGEATPAAPVGEATESGSSGGGSSPRRRRRRGGRGHGRGSDGPASTAQSA